MDERRDGALADGPPLLTLATGERWTSTIALVRLLTARVAATTHVIVLVDFTAIRCALAAIVIPAVVTNMIVHRLSSMTSGWTFPMPQTMCLY